MEPNSHPFRKEMFLPILQFHVNFRGCIWTNQSNYEPFSAHPTNPWIWKKPSSGMSFITSPKRPPRRFHGGSLHGGSKLHPLRRIHTAGTGMQHGIHARLLGATDGDAWPVPPHTPHTVLKTVGDGEGCRFFCPMCFVEKNMLFFFSVKITGKEERERERDLLIEKKGYFIYQDVELKLLPSICWLGRHDMLAPRHDIMLELINLHSIYSTLQ